MWKKIEIQKITPRFDLSWYIKWLSSFALLVSMVMTANFDMHPYNLMWAGAGTFGWFIVGMMWNDRALIFINSIATGIYSYAILMWGLKLYFT